MPDADSPGAIGHVALTLCVAMSSTLIAFRSSMFTNTLPAFESACPDSGLPSSGIAGQIIPSPFAADRDFLGEPIWAVLRVNQSGGRQTGDRQHRDCMTHKTLLIYFLLRAPRSGRRRYLAQRCKASEVMGKKLSLNCRMRVRRTTYRPAAEGLRGRMPQDRCGR